MVPYPYNALVNIFFLFLKVNIIIIIDPSIPAPELIHDEFFSYKKTIFQEHLFGQFFRERYYDIRTNNDLQPDLITVMTKIDNLKPLLISEVINL